MVKRLAVLAAAALWLVGTALLFLPPPRCSAAEETYLCQWQDGVTQESYASVFAGFSGADDAHIFLERDGKTGTIVASQAYRTAYRTLDTGSYAQVLSLSQVACTRPERAALMRTFSRRLWYANGLLSWNGETLIAADAPPAGYDGTLTIFAGFPAAGTIADLGVTALDCREGVEFSASRLAGTQVAHISVAPPYASDGRVVTLDTAGGRRIVCAAPTATSLVLPDADFADEGALAACASLCELTLPFAGSAKSGAGSEREGLFAHLFVSDFGYRVPETLAKVTVTGGVLTANTFYACPTIAEVNVCTVAAQDIDPDAFAGMDGLRSLHTPRADVRLTGTFAASPLPCGCIQYTKI